MRTMKKRYLMYVLCLLSVIMLFPAKAFAREPIDLTKTASLTIHFESEDGNVSGVNFKMYKVAEISEFCDFTPIGQFAEYPVSFENQTTDSWRKLATTLYSYVVNDQDAEPDIIASTDEEGNIKLENMELGLYLVLGESFNRWRLDYVVEPFLVNLPGIMEDNDTWLFDVTSNVKYSASTDSQPVDIEVLKVWDDNDNPDRPDGVIVQLYDGYTISETVILNKENNWHYKWSGIYGGTTWSVKEVNVPEGYTVSIDKQGDCFVITNSNGTVTPKTPGGKLPQTGVLWWPVPTLACAGIAVFLVGWIRRRRSQDEA